MNEICLCISSSLPLKMSSYLGVMYESVECDYEQTCVFKLSVSKQLFKCKAVYVYSP